MKIFSTFLILSFIMCGNCLSQGFLETPIKGTYLKDFFIINYVDQDTTIGGFKDPYCGTKSYDGHLGIDFLIRDYKQMDSGVAVVSAAPGMIFKVVDSLFDRETNGAVVQGFGNYIGIKHSINGKNYYTYYAHIKKNSSKVDSGTVVSSGQILAEVASSGYSLSPHLHFEIWDDSTIIDPFSAPCSFSKRTTLWKQILPYDTAFSVIQQGMFEHIASYDFIRERPDTKITFTSPQDSLITLWIESKGVKKNDSLVAEWLTPKGEVWFRYATMSDADYWISWWWTVIYHPTLYKGESGLWSVNFKRNGNLESTQSFTIVSSPNSVTETAASPIILTQLANTIFISSEEIGFDQSSVNVFNVLGNHVECEVSNQQADIKKITLNANSPHVLFIQVVNGKNTVYLKTLRW